MCKLLTPGGKIALFELSKPDAMKTSFAFGLLPGWWRVADEYWDLSAGVSEDVCPKILIKAGFSGIDLSLPDYYEQECHEHSVIVSTALEKDLNRLSFPETAVILDEGSSLQIGLAILFGPIISMDIFLFSVFRRARNTSHFVGWLSQRHEISLWSQLLFAIAISLACFVGQLQETCSIYETSIIMHLAGINVTSFLLTLSTYQFSIQRMAVFVPSIIIIYVFKALAEYIYLVRPLPFVRILQTCKDVAEDRKLRWNKDLVQPFTRSNVFPPLFAFTGLIIALTGLWLFLWLRHGRGVGTCSETGREDGDKSGSAARATPLQISN